MQNLQTRFYRRVTGDPRMLEAPDLGALVRFLFEHGISQQPTERAKN
jgi:hypothetical protein